MVCDGNDDRTFFICHFTFLIYHRQNLCQKKHLLFGTYYRTFSRNDRLPCPAQVNGNQGQLILEAGRHRAGF